MRAKKFRHKVKNYQVICTLLIGTSLLGTSYAHWTETLNIETNITTGEIGVDVGQPRDVHEVGNGPCNSNGGQNSTGYKLTNTGTVPVDISLLDISGEDITIYKITGDKDDWYEEGTQLQIDRDDLSQKASLCNKKCTVPSSMNLFDLLATKLVIQDGKTEGKKESIIGVDESVNIGFNNNAHLEEVIGLLNPKENGNGSTTGGILIRVKIIVQYNGWNKEITLEIPIKHGNMKALDLGPAGGNAGITLIPAPLPGEPEIKPTPPLIEVPEVLPSPEEKPGEPETKPTPPPVEVPEVLPFPEEKLEEETKPPLPPLLPVEVPEVAPVPDETPEGEGTKPISPPEETPGMVPDPSEKTEILPESSTEKISDIEEEAIAD